MTTLISTYQTKPQRFTGNLYFQDGMRLTGLLVTLLYLILALALDAAGHVERMTLLIPVTLVAALLGALMAYSRFDSIFVLSHGLFTSLAWILWLMARLVKEREIQSFLNFGLPDLQARAYFLLWKLLTWADAAFKGTASGDDYVFIFEIAVLLWWLTYLGVWAILRYGYTWRTLAPAGLVLLVNTYYAPQPVVGFLIAFCVVTLILLVHTHLAEQQLRWRARRISIHRDMTLDFFRHGVIYSVVGLSVAGLAPNLGRNSQVREFLAPINQRVAAANASLSQLYQGLNSRSASSKVGVFGRSLALRGARNVDDTPVFIVEAPVKRYWRAIAFDTFDGRQWLSTGGDEASFAAAAALPAPNWPQRELVTQTVTLLAPTGDVIFGAADLRQVSVATDIVAQTAPISVLTQPAATSPTAPGREVVYAVARQPLAVGDSYTVVSQSSSATRPMLENAGTVYPPAILEKYLQLPANFSPRVTQTAISVTVGATTPYAQAKMLETWLRTFPYNDAIAAPPSGTDPLEYFLFDIQEGYCDYYASALAAMLRSLGVPARTVSGYANGTFDEESGAYFVTARDAHTWVEVFFPNLGWVEFEPTANRSTLEPSPGEGTTDPATLLDPLTGAPNPLPSPEQPLPGDLQQPPDIGVGGGIVQAQLRSQPWWLWPTLALVLLALGLIAIRNRQLARATLLRPDLPSMLYTRLQAWGVRLGLRLRASDTPYEQARYLSRTLPGGQPQIAQITIAYVRYCYSRPLTAADKMLPPGTNEGLVQAWHQLRVALRRAWLYKMVTFLWRQGANRFMLVRE